MTEVPVELRFAVELATFLVASAGFAIVVLEARGEHLRSGDRALLAAGFAALATAAFLDGSLLAAGPGSPAVLGTRSGGLLLILMGSLRPSWGRPGATARRLPWWALLWLGLVLQAAAMIVVGRSAHATAALLGGGAAAIGTTLARAAWRSVAGKVAASAAATLLALVLVLSLSLANVLSSTVRQDALRQLEGRAAAEVAQVHHLTYSELPPQALLLAHLVQGHLDAEGRCPNSAGNCISRFLPGAAVTYLSDGAAAWVSPSAGGPGRVVARSAAAARLGGGVLDALAGSPAVKRAMAGLRATASVENARGSLIAVSAAPDVVALGSGPSAPRRTVGVAVVAVPLDASYLGRRSQLGGPATDLVLAGPALAPASSGTLQSPARIRALASAVVRGGGARDVAASAQLLAAQPIDDSAGRPVAALIATTSPAAVDQTLDSVVRTLFIIALGATLLALLLAAAVGDSVGNGLRRLAGAADAIRMGQGGVRAGLAGSDEVGRLGSAFDIMARSIDDKATALREAAEDEARLRGRLEAVVAGMAEAVVAVDHGGRITDCNQAAEELLGVSALWAVGRPVEDVVVLRDAEGADISGRLRQAPSRRWVQQAELVPAAAGEQGPVPVVVSGGAVRAGSHVAAGGVYVLRDLRHEQAVERARSELLSRVGHELRTPLTGIVGFTELLGRPGAGPERAGAWRQEILAQARRLLRTVELLEFFAGADGSDLQLDMQPTDLGQLAGETVRRWSERLGGSHLLTCRVDPGLPAVPVDRKWMGAALDELIDNAVKFSPAGGPVVVRAGPGPGPRWAEVSVTDRGKGMSPEEASGAFADFVQGDGSDTRRYGGLGLGLPLVGRVARGHGGRVVWESRPGSGSRFAVVVPVPLAADAHDPGSGGGDPLLRGDGAVGS